MKLIKISNNKEIMVFDDLIPYATRSGIYRFINSSLFRPDGKDAGYPEDAGEYHLYSSYSKDDLNNMKFLEIPEIQPILKYVEGYDIQQIRVNLSTLNDKNHFHSDGNNTKASIKTLIYYPNMKWNIEWGGHTLFADESISDIEYCTLYKPGRIILFDGSIPHCILPPTNLAPSYRYSFVIQYIKNL